MSEQALQGLKVVDFSRVIAGPLLTQTLALHGATVVRVESNHFLDRLRISAPYAGKKMGLNRSGYFSMFNANKYSITLNLDHPQAPELMRHLVNWCDVLVENFVPGSMEKRGFGYEDLRKIKPEIVMLSTSNQGYGGPFSRWGGYGYTLMALTGVTNLTGWEDRVCSHPFGALSDMICPILASTALLAALDYRNKTGKGQHLDMSQFEATLFYLSPLLVDYITSGHEFSRIGNQSLYAAPHGSFPCKGDDRWCVIAVENNMEWKVFCKVIGKPELVGDKRFKTFKNRKDHEDELNKIVCAWTGNKTPEEVMLTLQKAGIAAGVVQNPADIFNDPQIIQRKHFKKIKHSEMGVHNYEMSPFHLSETPNDLVKASPCLGEDNEYVCTQLLGLSDEKFLELLKENIFE